VGTGLSLLSHYSLWSNTALGGIVEKFTNQAVLDLRMDLLLKKSKLGFDVGFGAPLYSWFIATRVEF
jgi:hypothetical protein